MRSRSIVHSLVLFGALVALVAVADLVRVRLSAAEQREASEPIVLRPHEISWEPREEGVRAAVLHGDPNQPGPFTLRLEYPAGYRKGPHTHPRDAYVTVLEGSYYRGYGNTFDRSKAVKLIPGTFSVNPGGVSHYEWTAEPAVLQVHAVGPWSSTYVDASANPHIQE